MGQSAGTMATSLAESPPPPPQQQQTFKLLWKNSFEKIREKSAAAAGDDDDAFSFRVPEAGALMYRVVAWKKCLTKCKSFSALKKSEGDALEFLTNAWLESALGLPSVAITKIAKKAIGEGLGFLSMTFRLTVAYAADLETSPPTSLILKVPSCYEQSFEVIAEETDCYRREHDFYTEIEPTIAKEACGMRVPKVHKSELVDHGVRILMEDLGPLGFSVNQIDGLTYEQAKPSVSMAADLHATFWEGTGKPIPDCVARADDPRSFIRRWNNSFVERYEELLRSNCLEKFKIGVEKERVLEIAAKIKANADKILRWISKDSPQTFLHSDYRADNLIIGSDAEHAMSAVLDWQLLSTGPGVYDLGDLVVKSMTVEDNAMHLGDLLRLYHSTLLERGVRNYAYADLLRDFKFSILNHITLVFAIGVDGYDERGNLIADWGCFKLCRVMLLRLVRAIEDFECLSVLV